MKTKMTLLTLVAVLVNFATAEEDLNQAYEKAYFLETAKGKSGEAIPIYRKIATSKVNDENRSVVIRSLKRLLKLYEKDQPAEEQDLKEYFAGLNLDFEAGVQSEETRFPMYWMGGGPGYKMQAVENVSKSGKLCGEIKHAGGQGGFATFTGMLDVKLFKGKRLKYSGKMKLKDIEAFAGLWMRSDVGNKPATFYNMQDRELKGTKDWATYSFEIEIPENATNINFGALMSGKGTMWVDDLKIEIVEPEDEA